MCLKVITLIVSTIMVCSCNGAVLLWSSNKVEISPLSDFNDATLDDLVEKLGYPELTIYKSPSSLLPEFDGLLDGYYTAYTPNGDINTENATEISGRDDLVLLENNKQIDDNVLSVLVIKNDRYKRETEISSFPTQEPYFFYSGKSNKDNKEIYTMLYSSQPLLIRYENTSTKIGKSLHTSIGGKSPHIKLQIRGLEETNNAEQKILQFYFERTGGYWSLNTVKVSTHNNTSGVDLNITEPFSVPTRFSYHCGGETVFTDAASGMELIVYDMHVQMESEIEAFGDAYDCVDFTTVPIWSGLFVTALLGVGLIIALIAISEIKTMDKFDNQKTKQLVITVAE